MFKNKLAWKKHRNFPKLKIQIPRRIFQEQKILRKFKETKGKKVEKNKASTQMDRKGRRSGRSNISGQWLFA